MDLSESERGYVAGIIDGEGSLRLTINSTRGHKDWLTIVPAIKVATTNPELSSYLKKLIGGTTSNHVHFGPKHEKWKDLHPWHLTSPTMIRDLLETIHPYLIIKRKHSEIVLEYFRIRTNRRKGKHRPIPEREIELVRSLREINNGNHRTADSLMTQILKKS